MDCNYTGKRVDKEDASEMSWMRQLDKSNSCYSGGNSQLGKRKLYK